MGALKPIHLSALLAAVAGAVAQAAWSRCRAVPAVIGRATDPHVVPLFPPLPEVPGEAPVWRHRGSIERRTLAPEAVSAFLGH